MNSLSFHVGCKFFKVGKAIYVNSKILISFHIVNIQINAVEWNFSFLIFLSNYSYILFVLIAPTTLPVPKCPHWRYIASADKSAKLLCDIFFVFTCDYINSKIITFSMNTHLIYFSVSDIKCESAGIIKKCTEQLFTAYYYKIVSTIKRMCILMVIRIVAAPAYILPATLIYTSYLFSESINNVVFIKIQGKIAVFISLEIWEFMVADFSIFNCCMCRKRISENILFNHSSSPLLKGLFFFQ